MKSTSYIRHSTFRALLLLAVVAKAALAGDISAAAVMQVKANSIWFDDAPSLMHWQELKKRGDAADLAAYEKDKLGKPGCLAVYPPTPGESGDL